MPKSVDACFAVFDMLAAVRAPNRPVTMADFIPPGDEVISDTEIIDFMESEARYFSDLMQKDYAWGRAIYGPPTYLPESVNEGKDYQTFDTIRDSVKAAIREKRKPVGF